MPPKSCTRSASPTSGAAARPRRWRALKRAYELRPATPLRLRLRRRPRLAGQDRRGREGAGRRAARCGRPTATCWRRSPLFEAKRGERSAAIGWAQKLVALRPEDAEARALLAQVARRQAPPRAAGRDADEPMSRFGIRPPFGPRRASPRPPAWRASAPRRRSSLRSFVPNVSYDPPSTAKVGPPESFADGLTFVPDRRVFIVRDGKTFRAVSAVCTHLGCTVRAGGRRGSRPGRPRPPAPGADATRSRAPATGRATARTARTSRARPRGPLAAYRLTLAPDDGQIVVDLRRRGRARVRADAAMRTA